MIAASITCQEPTAPNAPSRIAVLGPAALHVGDQVRFHVVLYSQQGDTVTGPGAEWSSSDTAVAFVDLTGTVYALKPGQASIRASADGLQGSSALTITLAPVAKVQVTPSPDSLYSGTTLQLHAQLFDSANRTLTGRVVAWKSSDTTHGVVNDTGLVTARTPGSFTVTAVSEGILGGAFLNSQQYVVSLTLPDSFDLPRNEKVRFIPALLGSNGGQVADRPVTWVSSDTAVVRIDSTGVATPVTLGVSIIRATSGVHSDSCRVLVVGAPVLSLGIVTPTPPVVGRPVTAHGIAEDITSQLDTGVVLVWTSSDTSMLSVIPQGQTWPADTLATLVGHKVGSATVTLSAGGKQAHQVEQIGLPIQGARFLQDTLTLVAGGTTLFPIALRDTAGGSYYYEYYEATFSSTDTTIVTADQGAVVHGVKPGQAHVVGVSLEGYTDTATIIVVPAGTRTLIWAPSTGGVNNYDSVAFQLSWDTTGGAAEPPARAVTFTSSDTSVAAVPPGFVLNGSANVWMHSRRAGFSLIRASTDSTSRTFGLQVGANLPTSVKLTPKPTFARVGDTVAFTLSGTLNFPVNFSVSDSSRASVSPAGVVAFKGSGSVTVRGTASTLTDSAIVEVQSASAMHIDSVAPATMSPGHGAVIFGSGFTAGSATVSVSGNAALVGTVTTGSISITVPPATAFSCFKKQVLVEVASGGNLVADTAGLAVPDTILLGVGSAEQLPDSLHACGLLLSPGSIYRVSVINSSSAFAGFELRTAGTGTPLPAPPAPATGSNSRQPVAGQVIDSINRIELAHRRILETNRAHMARYGSPVAALLAARSSQQSRPAMSPSATVNGIAQIRIPRIDLPDYCSSSTTIQARLVYTGTHVRIFEDVAAPLAQSMDGAYLALGRQFDSADFPILQANFGNPLLLDNALDGSGKITLVFSPVVTSYGTTGFVTDCDFYPEAIAPSSNTTEIIYGPVPTVPPGGGFTAYTPQVWSWEEPSAIMHQGKHLVSYAYHLSGASSYEELWLEEATAIAAQEVWARGLYGTSWKGGANYQATLYCEVRPTTPACAGHPVAMFDAFAEFYQYAADHQGLSPLGPESTATDATFVGSGWAYLRWAIDQYAGSESAFLSALTQEPVLTGTANLAARTGHANAEMLSNWFTMWTFGGSASSPLLTFPSWNINNIWAGMNSDFPSQFPAQFPTAPVTFTATDSLAVQATSPVPPGTGEYYQFVNSANTPLMIQVSGPGGSALPAGVVVQLVRTQ